MNFEEQLLMELKNEIAHRADRRRRLTRRLSIGGAAALVAASAAVAVPLLTGTESPAYAVTKKADGTVRVQINEFENADRLERDLAAAGVRADITYLRAGQECKPGRGKTSGRTAMGPGSDAAARIVKGGLDIDPRKIGPNQTLVMEFAGNKDGSRLSETDKASWVLTATMITGKVSPCVVAR